MFWLALSTETLQTLEKLVFVNLCEYQWDRFLAAEVTVFWTNEGSNPRWSPLVPVTKMFHEVLSFVENL